MSTWGNSTSWPLAGIPISGTFTAHDEKVTSPFANANVPGYYSEVTFNQTYSGNITYTHTFTPTLFNELRVSVAAPPPPSYRAPIASLPSPASLGIQITPDLTTGPTNLDFDQNGTHDWGPVSTGPTRLCQYHLLLLRQRLVDKGVEQTSEDPIFLLSL